jgi:MFS family permease
MSDAMPSKFRLLSTFRALGNRNYRLFFIGQAISLIGTWMQMIALQWLVFRLTGSAAMLATINLVTALPLAPVALWGGSLADRFPKRSILLITQTVMLSAALLLGLLVRTEAVQVWQVLVFALITGAASAISGPVQQSFIVETVGRREDLANAIGLNSTINSLARAIGPAVAGVVVASVGEAGAFFLNALTFLAIIVSLVLMRLPARPPTKREIKLSSHLREALQYLRGHRTLLVLFSLVAVTAFLSRPYVVLLPVFAKDVLSSSAQPLLEAVCTGTGALFDCQSPNALTYGLLMAAMGLGSVIGALFVASLSNGASRGRLLTVGSIAFPGFVLAMALSRSFSLTSVLLVVIGVSFVTESVLANTLIQLHVPDELRGRVMSFYSLAVLGMTRVGGIQAGLLGDLFGAPLAVAVGAVICLAYALLVAWRYPRLRRMER